MAEVRELGPEDAAELSALYGEYDWWADRNVEDVRWALTETDLALGAFEDAGDERESDAEAGPEAGGMEGDEGMLMNGRGNSSVPRGSSPASPTTRRSTT